jgi:cell shape-determining protein MreC
MLKLGAKRRRTTAEVQRDKLANADKEAAIEKQIAAYNRLLKENEVLKEKSEDLEKAMEMIGQLEERDIIQRDHNNSYQLSDDAVRISKSKH